jgi:hypothetical protein
MKYNYTTAMYSSQTTSRKSVGITQGDQRRTCVDFPDLPQGPSAFIACNCMTV